jgi:hypothetical protein
MTKQGVRKMIEHQESSDNKKDSKLRYVVLELTEEEAKEIYLRRQEFLTERSILRRIPVSINEIDIDAWAEAFSIAAPHDEAIFSLFYFYEDYKAEMRCD